MLEEKLTQNKADILKAMAHPTRINILESLREGERCVCEIIELVDSEQSNTSQHLAQLKKNGIISSRKDGLKVIYKVNNREIFFLLDLLDNIIASQMEESMAILEGLKKRRSHGQLSP
ncbi:putative HTH-type transcriptional regulator [Pelotomaculum schinkii]|uniref:Putative HTH-type transcriptional regulator n=1 Tax=Pelotomaculum schinkii TaxID=78350 RepID=A0A4Y7R7Y4_9FIRM|nr:metalloregulator ArsR/SmtB family transcription factor [Pelotomaculum schinkii]TEB05085.1 putative HTH-type transcriptional regulator [Pelotomaculum schinkii]